MEVDSMVSSEPDAEVALMHSRHGRHARPHPIYLNRAVQKNCHHDYKLDLSIFAMI